MDAKEIARRVLQIEKCNADRSYGDIPTLLSDLDKSQVTAEQLETTDIVRVLYRLLRTCSDHCVKKTAKSLLSKWKRQYSKGVKCTEERGDPRLSARVSPPSPGEVGDKGVCKQGDDHGGPARTCDSAVQRAKCAEQEASSVVAKDGVRTDPCTAEGTSASCRLYVIPSSVRSKCDQLLLAALCPELPDQGQAAALARDIEEHIHELHKSSQVKYKACVRSKVANLRNPKNGHLRQGLLSGSLSPEAFARMSSEEMASVELRQLREEYSSRGVRERQLPRGTEGTQTQKIHCRRCGGSDCRVTQVSRGALFLPAWVRQGGPDDDAMTFVTCSGCGQQWYHSGWVCL